MLGSALIYWAAVNHEANPTWREDLRRGGLVGRQVISASFRGVPFLVDASERAAASGGGGARVSLRDVPFIDALGRRARSFRIDGYVIGDD